MAHPGAFLAGVIFLAVYLAFVAYLLDREFRASNFGFRISSRFAARDKSKLLRYHKNKVDMCIARRYPT